MKVLLIKTSSMGDIIHTLPALTDARNALPDISFDWVVEKNFTSIPTWHPAVNKIIPIALRRWRKGIFSAETKIALKELRKVLHASEYDLILDAQGLVKSAFITYFTKGIRAGLDWQSAREALASLMYQQKYSVNFQQHAIVRMRSLFSQALNYSLPQTPPDFGITAASIVKSNVTGLQEAQEASAAEKYIVFLHGTTWITKQWPEKSWVQLAALAALEGYKIKTSGGNKDEVALSERLAQLAQNVEVIYDLDIVGMAKLLANATAAVAVDTGFGHLSAALNIPTVSLYGPTNAAFTGAIGNISQHLSVDFPCAPCLSRVCKKLNNDPLAIPPCYDTLTPAMVWQTLKQNL